VKIPIIQKLKDHEQALRELIAIIKDEEQ